MPIPRKPKQSAMPPRLRNWAQRVQKLERMLGPELKHYVVTLPTGERVSLPEARERLLEMHSWKGLKPEMMREKLKKQERAFGQLRYVAEQKRLGKSTRQIARGLKIHPATINMWLAGKQMPRHMMSERFFREMQSRRRPLDIEAAIRDPVKKSDLAYLAGALFGNVHMIANTTYAGTYFAMTVSSREFANRVSSAIKHLIGKAPKVAVERRPSGTIFRVASTATELSQRLNQMTEYGEKIPRNLLTTKDSRVAFLKALFDSRGHLQTNRIVTLNPLNADVSDYCSSVLRELKILHTPSWKTSTGMIHIGLRGMERFMQNIGFRDAKKQRRLEAEVARIKKEGIREAGRRAFYRY